MASQITIGKKLYRSFGASLLLTFIVGGTAIWLFSSAGARVRRTVNLVARMQYLAARMDNSESEMVAADRGALIGAYRKDSDTVSKSNQEFQASFAALKKNLQELKPLVETEETRKILEEIEADCDAAGHTHQDFFALLAAGKTDAAYESDVENETPVLLGMSDALQRLDQIQALGMTAAVQDTAAKVALGHWVTITILILSLAVGALIVVIVRNISASLRQVIASLSEGAGQVASAASQISSSSQQLAQGASEQAASLEETSASSEEINSMARKNAENSQAGRHLRRWRRAPSTWWPSPGDHSQWANCA